MGIYADPEMRVGLRVRARYLATTAGEDGTHWYSASVIWVNDDGSCDVACVTAHATCSRVCVRNPPWSACRYDDGEMERHVAPKFLKVRSPRLLRMRMRLEPTHGPPPSSTGGDALQLHHQGVHPTRVGRT